MAVATFKSKAITDFLSQIQTKVKQFDKKEKQIGNFLSVFVYQDIIDHFSKQQGEEGKWAQRKQPYRSKIEGRGYTRILQVTGNLRQRIEPIKNGKSWRKDTRGILWFNNAKTKSGFPYAYAHDTPDPGRKTLPRRSFMWLSDSKMKQIEKALLSEFLGVK